MDIGLSEQHFFLYEYLRVIRESEYMNVMNWFVDNTQSFTGVREHLRNHYL